MSFSIFAGIRPLSATISKAGCVRISEKSHRRGNIAETLGFKFFFLI